MLSPTLPSLALGISAQVALWAWLFTPSSPIALVVRRLIRSSEKNVAENVRTMQADAYAAEKLALPLDDVCLEYYTWACVILAHHSVGALVTYIALARGDPSLFLLALSFELGEDVLHTAQGLHALLRPPGVKPFCALPKGFIVFVMMHHSLGLTLGVATFLYFPHWQEAQELTFCLYLAALPSLVNLPLFVSSRLHAASPVGWLNALISVLGLLSMAYFRVFKLSTLGYKVVARIFNEFGVAVGCATLLPLAVFAWFCLVSLIVAIVDVGKALRNAQKQPEAEQRLQASFAAVSRVSNASEPLASRLSETSEPLARWSCAQFDDDDWLPASQAKLKAVGLVLVLAARARAKEQAKMNKLANSQRAANGKGHEPSKAKVEKKLN